MISGNRSSAQRRPRRVVALLAASLLLLSACASGALAGTSATSSDADPVTTATGPTAGSTVSAAPLSSTSTSPPPTSPEPTSPEPPAPPTTAEAANSAATTESSPAESSTPSAAPTPTPGPDVRAVPPIGRLVDTPPCPGVRCVTLAMTGDVLLHPELIAQARQDGGGELDFFPMMAAQQPYIESADLGICHMETPLAPPEGPFSNYPAFSVPPQVLPAIKQLGYDACTTASNHTFDQGTEGIDRTLDELDAAGLPHDGSYRTKQDSQTPVVINAANGARVGLISVAYDWNGSTLDEPWQANPIDLDLIKDKARAARLAGADLVVVAMHAGEEYQTMPNAEQKKAAKTLLADPDIDLVYGHHVHVVQPMEKINGKWAIYGLGNNIAAQGTEVTGTRDGLLVRVQFSQAADGSWTTSDVGWVPSYQDLSAPYRWCPLTGGSSCASRSEDAASLERTTTTVNMWGADTDGAHQM